MNISISHPTLISNASFVDGALSSIGTFVWNPKNGPTENILNLVDFGLLFVLPFPMQLITLVASLYGYDLATLGRHIDTTLSLRTLGDAAAIEIDPAVEKLLAGLPPSEQKKIMDDFTKSTAQNAGQFPLSKATMNEFGFEKEAGLGVAAKYLAKIFGKKEVSPMLKETLATRGSRGLLGTIVFGIIGFLKWIVSTAVKIVGFSATKIINNPGKAIVGAGGVAIRMSQMSDVDGSDFLSNMFGDKLNKASNSLLKKSPTDFRGKVEKVIDETIMGAY